MRYEHILLGEDAGLAIVTMNRPERRNALSEAHMTELIRAFRTLADRGDARAIVLAAAGPVFSSGHDFADMVERDLDGMRRLLATCTELMLTIQRVPQPVVAQVQGVATAAGCQLVASCDLAVAAEEASFATPGGKGGWFCTTPMVAVARTIGRKRALEMLLTGDLVSADTALEWGLVNRVVPEDLLDGAVAELVERIVRSSPLTVAIGKEAFYGQVELDEHRAYELTKSVMTMNSLAGDAQEGMCAFLEKREPTWGGR